MKYGKKRETVPDKVIECVGISRDLPAASAQYSIGDDTQKHPQRISADDEGPESPEEVHVPAYCHANGPMRFDHNMTCKPVTDTDWLETSPLLPESWNVANSGSVICTCALPPVSLMSLSIFISLFSDYRL